MTDRQITKNQIRSCRALDEHFVPVSLLMQVSRVPRFTRYIAYAMGSTTPAVANPSSLVMQLSHRLQARSPTGS
jgi:hypothetical protein